MLGNRAGRQGGPVHAWAPSAAAFLAACVWALPHILTFYAVFVLAWWRSEPGTAAIAAAVGAAVQMAVSMAASRPVLQLLTCGIALLCAAVAHLVWGCAGHFVLMVALPAALAGLACLLSPWSNRCRVSRAVVWLAKASFLTTVVMCPMVRVVCTTTDWYLRAAVLPVLPLGALVAPLVPLGRLAAALLPDDIVTKGILAGSLDFSSLLRSQLLRDLLVSGVTALLMLLANWRPQA